MAYFFSIEDSRGAVVGRIWLGHLDRSYRLDDGGTCLVHDRVAWCDACRMFRAAEKLPDLERIEEERARLRKEYGWFQTARLEQDDIPQWMVEQYRRHFAEDVKRAVRHRAWRQRRRSPPRCLACGSTRIRPVPVGAESWPHPETGEMLTLELECHASLCEHDYFTEDGLRIPDEQGQQHPPPD